LNFALKFRYTVWVRRRSIMVGKGYMLQFEANTDEKEGVVEGK
jgi:hypothetical protein